MCMSGKNQLGRQHPRCARGVMIEFQRGGNIARIFKSMRAIRSANIGIAEGRRKEAERDHPRNSIRVHVGISNVRRGVELETPLIIKGS